LDENTDQIISKRDEDSDLNYPFQFQTL
jgi:hypothetical protein